MKVFCFGEILLRISPALNEEWIRRSLMEVFVGGSELNVATALTRWNIPVAYCSALPKNYLSDEICQSLSKQGIDISRMIFSGDRIGIYYLPQGLDLKHAGVIYDRAHSSFGALKPGTIDWNKMLDGMDWFHFSAITPALNAGLALLCGEALAVASDRKMKISVDLNFRSKLWQYGQNPKDIMPSLVSHCDLIMGNIWSANSLLGIPVDEKIHERKSREVYLEQAQQTAETIREQYPKSGKVAQTFRLEGEEGLVYYAYLDWEGKSYASQTFYPIVIDRVGTGDCFMGGMIYGINKFHEPQRIIDFATAAACGKFSEKGDVTHQRIEDVEAILKNNIRSSTH
ncbi:MAG: PfkB family carbohydrate kinase [Chitinophagales bacterium]